MIKNYLRPIVLILFCFLILSSKEQSVPSAQSALFNNLPRVALLVKEQYVDPTRINPDAMLAAILDVLASNISKVVIKLPKSLSDSLEKNKKSESLPPQAPARPSTPAPASPPSKELAKPQAPARPSTPAPTSPPSKELAKPQAPARPSTPAPTSPPGKEQIIVDVGGVKRAFAYEPVRSIWGMVFIVRDIFLFVESEAKKQKLAEKVKGGVEPIEWEKIEYAAINAMLATLDPHSAFLEPKYARDLTLTTKGEFGGVGIVISVRDGFLTVISPIDGTPAALKGVKAKDRIIKIDEDSAINMPLEDAVSKLRGAPNSTVKIGVHRANSPKELDFELKRSIIKVDSVAHLLLSNNVGYLRIKAFQGNTASDVQASIADMKQKSKNKLAGLILDLRDNPGGLLREAVSISDLFLNGGEVVSTQGAQKESRQVEMATPGQLDAKLKIAVLINGGSASASEIVSAALKYGGANPNEGRAILIGDAETFGKGSVQMLFEFPNINALETKEEVVQPAALKLTIAQYYAPHDRIIQTVGVKPDITIVPAHADKPKELSLFQSTARREIDLDAHLAATKNRDEKSLANISFLAPPRDEEANEYSKLSKAKLAADFAVQVASDFILASHGPTRKDMLAATNKVKTKLEAREQKKIIQALKKYKIDWSAGKALADKQALKISVVSNNESLAGEKLKITLKIKNLSKSPAYQVHAITHSKTDIFDQREFIFGKLNPGQEIERSLEFDIPKDVITRKDLIRVEVRDVAQEKLDELNLALAIKGLERPRFAHMIFVDDEKSKNGEEIELVLWLKNIGEGKAFEPTVLLRNDSGSKIFLKTGREKSGELLSNQETSMRFSFRVKEPTDKANFELQIFDGQMHDVWRDKLSIPVNQVAQADKKKIANQPKILSEPGVLLAKAQAGAQVLAQLKPGLLVTALSEESDYYLVKVANNLVGFIKKSGLKDGSAKALASSLYTINYDRVPAQLKLQFENDQGWSVEPSGELHVDIKNAERVSEVLLYVNGKKVLYQAITKPEASQKISQQVNLKPGMNVISVVAREDSHYGQRDSITVYYDDQKLSLAKPEAAPKTNARH